VVLYFLVVRARWVAERSDFLAHSLVVAKLPAHLYAVLRAERQQGSTLDAADERIIFAWLLEQTGMSALAAQIARFECLGKRRIADRIGLRAGGAGQVAA